VRATKNVDNFMGEMNKDATMINRAVTDAMGIFLRSPSFTIGGSIRGLAGGWLSNIQGLARPLKGERPELRASITSRNYDPRASMSIGYPLATLALGLLYTWMKKGKVEGDDIAPAFLGTPHTGGTAPGVGGQTTVEEEGLLPGYHKDWRAYLRGTSQDVVEELKNKQSGLLQSLEDQIMNSRMTAYGPEPIRAPQASFTENLGRHLKAAAEKAAPIFFKQAMQPQKKGSNISYPEQLIGVRPPGTWQTDPTGYEAAKQQREIREYQRAERARNRDLQQRGLPTVPLRQFNTP
jgi:hypothetical protein